MTKIIDTPVFKIENCMSTYPNGDTLPDIWVTEPVYDDDGKYAGREPLFLYSGADEGDAQGYDALDWGADFYNEAMSCTTEDAHERRVDCFRVAEILYRHAAGAGNEYAHLNLGYVYSYDRCEGKYWTCELMGKNGLKPAEECAAIQKTFPREERAFECFKCAAEADVVEACYKLGDMYKRGRGCEANAKSAFEWYSQAVKLSDAGMEPPVILGSIALRLGDAYEEGFGCKQSFENALKWYERAVAGLEVAVRSGENWYSKPLRGARDGVKRCKQELAM